MKLRSSITTIKETSQPSSPSSRNTAVPDQAPREPQHLNLGASENGVREKSEKQYACSLCPYESKYRTTLIRHMKRMHEQRSEPIVCCHYNFLTKGEWKNHRKRVHQPKFKCGICHRGFANRWFLRVHIAGIHTEKRLQCKFCNYATPWKKSLQLHSEKKHPGRFVPWSTIKQSAICATVPDSELLSMVEILPLPSSCSNGTNLPETVPTRKGVQAVEKSKVVDMSDDMSEIAEVPRFSCPMCAWIPEFKKPCPLSNRLDQSHHLLESHMERTHKILELLCCGILFSTNADLLYHRKKFCRLQENQCSVCRKGSTSNPKEPGETIDVHSGVVLEEPSVFSNQPDTNAAAESRTDDGSVETSRNKKSRHCRGLRTRRKRRKFRVHIEEIFPGPNGFKTELVDCEGEPNEPSGLTDWLVDKIPGSRLVTQNNHLAEKFRVQIEEIFPGPNGFKHELIDCNIDPDQSSDLTDSLVDKTPDRQPVTQNNEVIPSCPAIPRDMLSVPDTVIQLPAIILEEEEAASTILQPQAANGIAQIESQHTARKRFRVNLQEIATEEDITEPSDTLAQSQVQEEDLESPLSPPDDQMEMEVDLLEVKLERAAFEIEGNRPESWIPAWLEANLPEYLDVSSNDSEEIQIVFDERNGSSTSFPLPIPIKSEVTLSASGSALIAQDPRMSKRRAPSHRFFKP